MSLIFDAGAFIAIEHGDRDLVSLIKRERLANRSPLTSGGVIGQVWRGGFGRQANLARLLPGVDVRSIDDDLGRRSGLLLGATRRSDVIDASVVLLADDGDEIFTSDPDDLEELAAAAGTHVELVPI